MAEEAKKKEDEKSWRERWDSLKEKEKKEEPLLDSVRSKQEAPKRPDSQSAGVTILPKEPSAEPNSLLEAARTPAKESPLIAQEPAPQGGTPVVPMANAQGVNQMPPDVNVPLANANGVAPEPSKQLAGGPDEMAKQAANNAPPPSEAPPTPEQSSPSDLQNVNFAGQSDRNRETLERAHEERRKAEHIANMGRAFNLLGAGIARANPSEAANDLYKHIEEQGQQKEADVKELMSNEENDPHSAVSAGFREYVKGLGVNLQGASAADASTLLPTIYKKYIDQVNNTAKANLNRETQSAKRDASDEQLSKKLEAALNIAKIRLAGKQADTNKAQAQTEKDLQKLNDALDPNKSRTGNFGQQQNIVYAANKIKQLAKQFPNLNLPPAQVAELAQATAGMLSNGNRAAESTVERYVPHSIGRDAASWTQWITNNPQGASQQAFVKQMLETAQREGDLAQSNVNQTKFSRIAQFEHLKQKNPQQYENILRSQGVNPEAYEAYKNNGYQLPSEETKPKKVIQNGHTYILNEKTGQYE